MISCSAEHLRLIEIQNTRLLPRLETIYLILMQAPPICDIRLHILKEDLLMPGPGTFYILTCHAFINYVMRCHDAIIWISLKCHIMMLIISQF